MSLREHDLIQSQAPAELSAQCPFHILDMINFLSGSSSTCDPTLTASRMRYIGSSAISISCKVLTLGFNIIGLITHYFDNSINEELYHESREKKRGSIPWTDAERDFLGPLRFDNTRPGMRLKTSEC